MSGLARTVPVAEVPRATARAASTNKGNLLPRAASAICGRNGVSSFAPKVRNERRYKKEISAVANDTPADAPPPPGASGEYDDEPVWTGEEERLSRAMKLGQDCASSTKMFKKIMCANRGEIAVRVFRAGSEVGARTVAIYSPQDRLQPHRYKADESYCVGEGKDISPVECYLDIEDIVRLAVQHGVEAIHPGYGFLSERADFARLCKKNGIQFVGPDPETLDQMGDKTAARSVAIGLDIPVIPGTDDAVEDLSLVEDFVEKNGLPVILKAAMGGGGRGMRVVRERADLADLFLRATSEARSAFGDGRVFIERFIEVPRHIEVQILADGFGNVVHLHERDCSVQRRHQKVIEMAPALNLPEKTKQAIFADAVKLAKGINYKNAGTVEFLVDSDGTHYFIEVNPRVQVEHTVTEEVTGIDIVQSQLKIAAGASLADIGINSQADVECRGVAIQTRITTEDPAMNFQPDIGRLEVYRCPGGMGVRIDSAMTAGCNISPHYDSLLTKLTVHSATFNQSVQKLYRCLCEFRVRGVKTNIPFLQNVLCCEEFLDATIDTNYVDNTPEIFNLPQSRDRATRLMTYLAEQIVNGPKHPGAVGDPPAKVVPVVPPVPAGRQAGGWRQVLQEHGPKEFARRVRAHKGLLLTDTTMRDAHQSLLATRVRTIDMLRIADYTSHCMNEAYSLEVWGGATFDVSMRFLHECPWDRLEQLREKIPNVPFQMLLRGTNAVGYTTYPDNAVKAFVKEAYKRGIDIFRVFDSLNYIENLKFGIEAVHAAGGVVEAVICYTGDVSDPSKTKYNLDYYVNLATELVECDIHVLCIKDMAGLLKPKAATMLVGALREKFPDLPIHVHTHDTAGVGVASMLACAEAGADVVDVAVDSMSGLTSQPSAGAVIVSTEGTKFDTRLKLDEVLQLNEYWEQVRGLYRPYECSLRSGTSDVFSHEMPGGQYTNLKFQATSLGLGEQWEKVKKAYAMANDVCGDIVKVTPSSKVVGDLAQFMVSNDLDTEAVRAQAATLSFPDSVVDFFQGNIGQPAGGFPPIQKDIVKDLPVVTDRPGKSMADLNLRDMRLTLSDKFNKPMTHRDVLASAMYPKVFEEFKMHQQLYSDVSVLPTREFLAPMEVDQEVEIVIDQGKSLFVTYKAMGDLKSDGRRTVFFELNGIPRSIEVLDTRVTEVASAGLSSVKERSDPLLPGSVGAPMSGDVVEVKVKTGDPVQAGEPLVVMSAMKMETTVSAPVSGLLTQVACSTGDNMKAGDLLVLIDEKDAEVPLLPEALVSRDRL
eukprot:CAMPEP_0118929078 /NCGR_PEP_ID=MMETSP1169-20130426/6179_1 /TAXON_ID=36882 /ORGANISM="Pyramimonas obovata, Strain CCMP722" /LENGTH=1274 /DNA_ID=CAMNT_0006871201 /DNA_START=88 /DNA_END=3912 /DNA_ORIENTATION=-